MNWNLLKLKAQVSVLRDVQKTYGSHTIDNAIQQIESRIKFLDKYGKEEADKCAAPKEN